MSDRSLARVLLRLADQRPDFRELVASVEQSLRMLVEGETVTYGDCVVTMLAGEATVIDQHRGASYPIREWSRRYSIEQATMVEVE